MSRPADQPLSEFLGPGALTSLLLAGATVVGTVGAVLVWRLRRVLAATVGDELASADAVLVVGRELIADRPSAVFRARLERGAEIVACGLAPRLIIAGGHTGTARLSEAAAGREYLLGQGFEEGALLTEERSTHTLENLFNVRETLRERRWSRVIIVSDPLHLARIGALAHGLGLDFRCGPATASPPRRGSVSWWLRAWREACLLHWYHVGVAYSRFIGSERLLSRVT